jgi:hypothetical protein
MGDFTTRTIDGVKNSSVTVVPLVCISTGLPVMAAAIIQRIADRTVRFIIGCYWLSVFWAKIHIIPDILVGGSSFFAGNFVGTEKNSTFARQIRVNMELKTK